MEKLYYDTPYVKTFEAMVERCDKGSGHLYEVVLDQTGFYPEGGGQPADTGVLGDVNVVDVHEKQDVIIHMTDGPLEPGMRITGIIDWERRYSNMQQHSGEHLLSGLIHKYYGYDNVGFHMGSEEVTVDFNGPLSWEQVEVLEEEANAVIYKDVPILETYPSAEELHRLEYRSKKKLSGQVRVIEIPGGDICACCGTHVKTTGEIGVIKVTGMINYKGGVRMSMLCGMRALKDYGKKQKTVTAISVLLSSKSDAIVETVEKIKKDSLLKDMAIGRLYQKLFQEKADKMPGKTDKQLLFEEELTPVLLRQFCTLLYEEGKADVVMVCSGEEGHYQYALGSGTQDMRIWSKELNQQLNGRGGGSALMAQGTYRACRAEIESVWKERG